MPGSSAIICLLLGCQSPDRESWDKGRYDEGKAWNSTGNTFIALLAGKLQSYYYSKALI